VAQAFLAGVADRTSFEDWIAGLKGMTLQGANAWAAHRSDKSPLPKPSCPPASAYGVDFTAGCVQAKAILDPDDASRLADSSYRAGWNSIP
jgi:hypothetical protein